MILRFKARRSVGLSLVLAFVSICILTVSIQAQTPMFWTSGATGSGGNVFPFGSTSGTSTQTQYANGEIVGAYGANITAIYFQRNTASTATTYTNMRVWISQTNSSNFNTSTLNFYTPAQLCAYYTSFVIPAGNALGWFQIPLQTPFAYNPSLGLMVRVCQESYSGGGITINTGSNTAYSYRRLYYNAGTGGCTATSANGTDASYYWFGVDLASPYAVDAGISDLVSPVNFCSGTYDVVVNLKNYGTQPLLSTYINWKYDNVTQSPVTWTGNLTTYATTPVTLGTRTFSSGTPHTLQVWTSNPNNAVDSGRANDTLAKTLQPALNGTYTIGGTTPDFATFAAATSALQNYGVCGPVVFNVRAGTYTEAVTIPNASGASATNTIIFQSETGLNSSVIINNTGTSATNQATVLLNGSQYVTFQNMTIRALGSTYSYGIQITGSAAHNRIIGNIVYNANLNTTYGYGLYAYQGIFPDHLIQGNTFQNGYYGLYVYGLGTGANQQVDSWVIDRNTIQDVYYMSWYTLYTNSWQVTNNIITSATTYTAYGMYFYYGFGPFVISGNRIALTGTAGSHYGLMNYYNQCLPGQEGKIYNNMVFLNGATTYAFYDYYGLNSKIYNNTVYSTGTSGYTLYCYHTAGHSEYMVNNIFYNMGGYYAMYVYSATSPYWDYNLWYTNGSILGYVYPTGVTFPDLATWKTNIPVAWDRNAISKTIQFANVTTGDLHLAGTSQNDMQLPGIAIPEVTNDIDGDPRVLYYRGADEACYILPGSLTQDFVDNSGNTLQYAEVPGTIKYKYGVSFPANTNFAVSITLSFINVATGQTLYTYQFTVNKVSGVPLNGVETITLPNNLPVGSYKVNAVYNTMNSCNFLINYNVGLLGVLVVPKGTTPCTVWPGDANNDGVDNFADQKTINKYILNAGLKPTWLNGPARYNAAWEGQPALYLTWVGQMCAPWATSDGCYIDTDGNGVVNNFDYLAVKINWAKSHGPKPAPKSNPLTPDSFDMTQNYPNPFNPTTTLIVSVPEASTVRLVVTDMLGREVATLLNGQLESGVHPVVFDASRMASGTYIATVTMTGEGSGLTFSKTVRMTLSK